MAKAVNQEWFEKLGADVLPKFSEKKPGKLNTFTYTEIWTDNPDGSTFWFYVDVQDNVCVDHKCGFGEGTAPDASFTVIGPYENFAKVITGEWDSKTPLVKGNSSSRATCLQQSLTLAYTRALSIPRRLLTGTTACNAANKKLRPAVGVFSCFRLY